MAAHQIIASGIEQPGTSSYPQSQTRNNRGQPPKTLMDRVLVTPLKKTSRFQTACPEPVALSRSLRHSSQRTISGLAFAPYPKRNLTSGNVGVLPPPRTPKSKLRRTLSERSYFNGPVAEGSISSKAHQILTRTATPNQLFNRPRGFSQNGHPLTDIKPQNPLLNSSNLITNSVPTQLPFGSSYLNFSQVQGDVPGTESLVMNNKDGAQDIVLDFQSLHLEEAHVTKINPSDCSWSSACGPPKAHGAQGTNPIYDDGSLPSFATGSWDENEGPLVARLRQALAAETRARRLAEQQHRREMKRRIKMEELVAQLQCHYERKEYLNSAPVDHQPPPSSSPLLLSSSPCTSRLLVNHCIPPLPSNIDEYSL